MRHTSVQPFSINQNTNQYHEPHVQEPKTAVSRWFWFRGNVKCRFDPTKHKHVSKETAIEIHEWLKIEERHHNDHCHSRSGWWLYLSWEAWVSWMANSLSQWIYHYTWYRSHPTTHHGYWVTKMASIGKRYGWCCIRIMDPNVKRASKKKGIKASRIGLLLKRSRVLSSYHETFYFVCCQLVRTWRHCKAYQGQPKRHCSRQALWSYLYHLSREQGLRWCPGWWLLPHHCRKPQR